MPYPTLSGGFLALCRLIARKRGVQAARYGPSPPPTPAGGPVAKAEMSTADRLWFQGRVEPGRAPAGEGRELLTQWGDERASRPTPPGPR